MDFFEDEPCEQCGSTTYTVVNAIKTCENGHDQGEGQVVGEDEADFGTQGRTVRRKVEKTRQKTSKVYRGPRAYRLFTQAYQFILWKQCYALIHEKKLPPELWTIVRDLWALRLSQLVHRLESPSPVESESQAVSSTEESGNDKAGKTQKRIAKEIDSPKLVETIALCYMAMLLLRLPIGLSEVFRWIKEEEILYIRAIRGVPADMREKLPGEYHMLLDTTVMLQPEDLHDAISDLATMYHQAFGLALPPLNHEVMLYKYIVNLALPLEIFPVVQGLAELIRSKFCYSTTHEVRRKRGSTFPELQLISLLVIAVKIVCPFDDVQRHPRSIHEPATQKIDWKVWRRHREDMAQRPPSGSLSRGSEIEIRDTDVFQMSKQELDSYMSWYQKTWVREPRPGAEDSIHKEILDMFPLQPLNPSIEQTSLQREQELQRLATQKAQATTASLIFQPPVTDEEVSEQGLNVKRPGEDYPSYKSEQGLPESARAFFEAAAETGCTSVKHLILAVLQTEARIKTWKKAKRRAEVTGRELDLVAELRGSRGGRAEVLMSDEVKEMDIGGDECESGESREEDSDTDLQCR